MAKHKSLDECREALVTFGVKRMEEVDRLPFIQLCSDFEEMVYQTIRRDILGITDPWTRQARLKKESPTKSKKNTPDKKRKLD